MPRYTRQCDFSFDESHITHFGGMWLIQRFCNQIRLRYLIQKYIRFSQRKSQYHPSELILALLFAIVLGLRRINKTDILQYNGAFLSMLGLDRFPDQGTLRRFLRRISPPDIRQLVRLHDSLRDLLSPIPSPRHGYVFDVDASVLVIYGTIEGARVGYNPKKPGRRSYHPLFCFEASREEFWHGSLRRGDTASFSGLIPFLSACLSKVPKTIPRSRIRFRMDSGFYSPKTLSFLDGKGCRYVIVARQYAPIRAKARTVRFQKMANGWEVGEFWLEPSKNLLPHRYIVVRRPIPEDPVEAQQLTLFKDKIYAYHVLVTNLNTSPWRAYRFYSLRANVEKHIRELVYDYPLAKIPTRDWTANVAFFQLVLFACNIVHWFKRMCLPAEWRFATLDTIRTDFLVLPAKLVKEHKRNIVRLPRDYHYQKEFRAALAKIQILRWPRKFRICK